MPGHSRTSRHIRPSIIRPSINGQLAALTLAVLLSASPAVAAEEPFERVAPNADRAAAVLDGLAEEAHRERLSTAYTILGAGITATGIGLIAELEYDKSYGSSLWIAGAGGMLGSVLSLLMSTPIERFAEERGARAPGYSPEALAAAWRERIESERATRTTIGIVSVSVGTLLLGATGALLAGVGDMDHSERGRLVVITGLLGGANLSGGLVTLLIESDLERAFATAYGPSDVSSFDIGLGIASLRGGGAVEMHGTF